MLLRLLLSLLLLFTAAWAANQRLYLKDGTYHMVREYKVEGERVVYYSTERSDWEEIPLDLVDLKRTQEELRARQETLREDAAIMDAEENADRAVAREISRIPQGVGVFWSHQGKMAPLQQAEANVESNRRRSLLKMITPIPIVAGKAHVTLEGPRSQFEVTTPEPEFYFRLANRERFGLFRLKPQKDSRIVQVWNIVPVSNEIIEEQEEVEIFRQEIASELYKIWPKKPLEPGQYAVVEYTAGLRNIQIWDFSYNPEAAPSPQPEKPPSSGRKSRSKK
jgi:hypothetical protein